MTTPSYPETLHVIRLDRAVDKAGAELPPAFIEVGDWTYPLVRGKSPIMKSNYGETVIVNHHHLIFLSSGGYMFPDLEKGNIAGGAVGLLIPESVTEVDR